jgi:hypothetical protein
LKTICNDYEVKLKKEIGEDCKEGEDFKEKVRNHLSDELNKNEKNITNKMVVRQYCRYDFSSEISNDSQLVEQLKKIKNTHDEINVAHLADEFERVNGAEIFKDYELKEKFKKEENDSNTRAKKKLDERNKEENDSKTRAKKKIDERDNEIKDILENNKSDSLIASLTNNPFGIINELITNDSRSDIEDKLYTDIKNLFENYNKKGEFETYELICNLKATLKDKKDNFDERIIKKLKLTTCPLEDIKRLENQVKENKQKNEEKLAENKFNKFSEQLESFCPKTKHSTLGKLVCKIKELIEKVFSLSNQSKKHCFFEQKRGSESKTGKTNLDFQNKANDVILIKKKKINALG